MYYRKLGESGIDASVVGLGAWAIGGWLWGGQDDRDSIQAIHAALDRGINLIDTAPIYGFGRSEEIVGKAIADRRDSVVLATKCGLRWEGSGGEFHFASDDVGIADKVTAKYQVHRYLAPESIRLELENSLRRLGVETIDLYQTHWQESTTPVDDTMQTLVDLKTEGKIRAIGVCNATVEQIVKYRRGGVVDTDQEKYSMLDRKLEKSSLPYCRKHGIAFLAYSPMAGGLLSGKIGPDRKFGEGDLRARMPRFNVDNRRRTEEFLDELRPIAVGHSVTLAQLAVAWTVAQPGATHALCGIRNLDQAKENAEAAEAVLSAAELRLIDEAIERHSSGIV
jgi:aryl-alcohol dehydrogenase-like predicted oxidoreductase